MKHFQLDSFHFRIHSSCLESSHCLSDFFMRPVITAMPLGCSSWLCVCGCAGVAFGVVAGWSLRSQDIIKWPDGPPARLRSTPPSRKQRRRPSSSYTTPAIAHTTASAPQKSGPPGTCAAAQTQTPRRWAQW